MTSLREQVYELSVYPHTYATIDPRDEAKDSEDGKDWITPMAEADLDKAHVMCSGIADQPGYHTLMLDIDVPARLVPSSTPGNSHLYIDVPMKWENVADILEALANAGVVQEGYFQASVAREYTSLRLPWVRKQRQEELPF